VPHPWAPERGNPGTCRWKLPPSSPAERPARLEPIAMGKSAGPAATIAVAGDSRTVSARPRPSPLYFDTLGSSPVDTLFACGASLSDDECYGLPSRCHEVPVRRTFIDFPCSEQIALHRKPLPASTAPAAMSHTISDTFGSWKALGSRLRSPSCDDPTFVVGPPSSSTFGSQGSSRWVAAVADHADQGFDEEQKGEAQPSVIYRLSPTSAKAAGYYRRRDESPRGPWPATPPAAKPAAPKGPPPGRFDAPPAAATRPPGSWAIPASASSSPTARASQQQHQQAAAAAAEEDAEDAGSSSEEGDSSDDEIQCPQYSENAAIPSVGSALHKNGTCKRCCFFPKGRCNNGADCQFCHFAHDKRKPAKKKKKKKKGRSRKQSQSDPAASSPAAPPHLASTAAGFHDQQQFILVQAVMPAPFFSVPNAHGSMFLQMPYCNV